LDAAKNQNAKGKKMAEENDQKEQAVIQEPKPEEEKTELIAEPAAEEPAEELEEEPAEELAEESEEGDSPLDILEGTIDRIDKQIVRLQNRNAGNLKFELINNLYPIMSEAFTSILTWMAELEDSVDDEDDDGQSAEEFQKTLRAESERVLSVCQKLISAKESGSMSEDEWKMVVDWAEETYKKVQPVLKENNND